MRNLAPRSRHRIAVLSATAAFGLAAGGVVLATASPARADAAACEDYLYNHGYTVGTKVVSACTAGATGIPGQIACVADLENIGVSSHDAGAACDKAAE